MIKRPFVYVLFVYAAGCLIAGNKSIPSLSTVFLAVIIITMIFAFLQLFLHILKLSDCFLIFLPLILYSGIFLSNRALLQHPMDDVFKSKADVTVTGNIYKIVDSAEYTALYLNNNHIHIQSKVNKSNIQSSDYESGGLLVYTKELRGFRVGNRIEVRGRIMKFKRPRNSGQFDEYMYYKAQGIDYKVTAKELKVIEGKIAIASDLAYRLKNRMADSFTKLLPERDAGIIDAMLLGDKRLLAPEEKRLYDEGGFSHILAISGLHVSLIGMFLYRFLRFLRVPYWISAILTGSVLLLYGLMTNFSVSTKRAVFMMLLLFGGQILGRSYDMLTAASLGALLLLVRNPLLIYDCGFLLSFGAVFGIGFLLPVLKPSNDILPELVSGSLYTSLSIQLATLPILLYYFYEIPLYGILVNIMLLPFVSVIVGCALTGGMIAELSLFAARFLLGGSHYLLEFYRGALNGISKLPFHMLVLRRLDLGEMLLYYALLVTVVWYSNLRKQRRYFICMAAVLLFMIPWKNNYLEITLLDVGQGDGIHIKTPDGKNYLLDGGSSDVSRVGEYRILPYLKSRGVSQIDYLMVSHGDADHMNGAMELIALNGNGEYRIKNLILPGLAEPDEALVALAKYSLAHGVPVIYFQRGSRLRDREVLFTCLHPPVGYRSDSKNDTSMVLSLEFGSFSMLFTGDLEKEGERLLFRTSEEENELQPALCRDFDVLKVAHHGSGYSTLVPFLNIVRPEVSLISCAEENSYGHPNVELLERLTDAGSKIYITALHGAVTLKTDGQNLLIKTFLSEDMPSPQ